MYNNREHLIEEFSKPFSTDKHGNIIREQITESYYGYTEFDTSNVTRTRLQQFIDMLSDKEISYSMEPNGNISFDPTELDKGRQKLIKKIGMKEINETVYEIDEELLNEMIKKNVNVKPKEGETYKEFFKRAMKEYGIDDITDMTKEEKDKFFTDIERSYTDENPKTNDKDKVDESFNMDNFRDLSKMKQGPDLEDYINKKFKTVHFDEMDKSGKFIFIEENDDKNILKKVEKLLKKEGFNVSFNDSIPAILVK